MPSHIVARHWDYCCNGFLTFCGIVFGVAVLLVSSGPTLLDEVQRAGGTISYTNPWPDPVDFYFLDVSVPAGP